ncbi:MAG: hypothetical protein ACM3SQ_18835 [Betaproteobacteria bacterium]
MALLVTATLTAAPAVARQPPASPSADSSSQMPDGQQQPASQPPTSVDKIRKQLEQPQATPLRGLDETPTFSVEIQETQRFKELVDQLKFDSGPAVPGGLYGYEQQQVTFPKTQYPLMQPYAAFNQGQLLTIAIENILGRYVAGPVAESIRNARRASAEADAREQVRKALAEFWTSQTVKPQ